MKDGNPYLVPAALLSLSLIASTWLLSHTWQEASMANQTIVVTGSAKRDIISDYAVLRGSFGFESKTMADAYKALERNKPELLAFIKEKGFTDADITFYPITNNPIYELTANGNSTNNVRSYVCNQRLELRSTDVQKVKDLSLSAGSLIEKGISFNVESPEYFYTKLANMKVEIQSEAAKDAMTRAQKIAEATGKSIGAVRSARMGVLQITPKFSTSVSDEGMNDVSSIEKEITAVVNASFEIR